MNNYAVALVNYLGDLGLQLKVVRACGWQEALGTAFPGYLKYLSADAVLEETPAKAKIEAANQDWEFEVLKVA